MKQLLINRSTITNGYMTIQRSKTNDNDLTIQGILKTHKYLEEITEIESDRYKVTNVDVFREDYGTDDFFIIYSFTADDIIIKGGESNLSEEEIDKIESNIKGSESNG